MAAKAIRAELSTEEPDHQELCRTYWQVDETGRFVHPVSYLADRFGMSKRQVTSAVAASSVAFIPDNCCIDCMRPHPIRSRKRIRAAIRQHYAIPPRPALELYELTFEESVYLVSFLRVGTRDDFS